MKEITLKTLQTELTELASAIEKSWIVSTYSLDLFPDLCYEFLEKYSLDFNLSLDKILQELPNIDLPLQTFPEGEFSDFPLTLVRTEKILIDMYFWFKSDTSIHNHHFCGAFKIIGGESYQVSYRFDKTNNISPGLDEGVMTQVKNEHLTLGSVNTIKLRDNFIHHVFHLGKPTITLCVRTPFLEGEDLSTFIYPKYRVVISKISIPQKKWLQILRLQLEQDPGYLGTIPWADGEIARMLYLSSLRQLQFTPEVANYLLNYLEKKSSMSDFFELLKKQTLLNDKLKKFGLITSSSEKKID